MSDNKKDNLNEASDYLFPELESGLVSKSERTRMIEFFKNRTEEESKIILEGKCPKCFKLGRYGLWDIGRGGGKYCPRCGWMD